MRYRYTGPMTAMTLKDGRDVILSPGTLVELPENADVTATLVALGRLAPETDAPEPPAAKTKNARDKE